MDAIVNSANQSLHVGGGVDGAIHEAAGPGLQQEAKERYGTLPPGRAVVTGAHNLPAKAVIHTVGPRYMDGLRGEDEVLHSCYRLSLELADEHGHRTVAFPMISTGVYGYPKEEAAKVAYGAISEYLASRDTQISEIYLVAASESDAKVLEEHHPLNRNRSE